MDDDRIDEALWRRAAELAKSPAGLDLIGLGRLRRDHFEPASSASKRVDAPELVVAVAGELGIEDEAVRARLRKAVEEARSYAVGRPAPLGTLGLLELRGGETRFYPSRTTTAAPPDAFDAALAAWRTEADSLEERVEAFTTAAGAIAGRIPPREQSRLLDELDYDLDEADWQRFGERIIAAFPY